MIPQDRLADDIADWLAASSDADARRYVAYLLDCIGLDALEVRMWGLRVPTEDV